MISVENKGKLKGEEFYLPIPDVLAKKKHKRTEIIEILHVLDNQMLSHDYVLTQTAFYEAQQTCPH